MSRGQVFIAAAKHIARWDPWSGLVAPRGIVNITLYLNRQLKISGQAQDIAFPGFVILRMLALSWMGINTLGYVGGWGRPWSWIDQLINIMYQNPSPPPQYTRGRWKNASVWSSKIVAGDIDETQGCSTPTTFSSWSQLLSLWRHMDRTRIELCIYIGYLHMRIVIRFTESYTIFMYPTCLWW